MGTLAAIGVVLNNNNINELSKDQDSICTTVRLKKRSISYLKQLKFELLSLTNYLFHIFQTQGIGNTALTLTALTDITTTNPTNTEIVTRLNLIENAINNWSTPDCN